MKQKAQIDVIDITIPESDLGPAPEEREAPPAPPEAAPPAKFGKRLPWFVGGAVVVVVAIVAVWYLTMKPSTESVRKEQGVAAPAATPATPAPTHGRLPLSDFFVEVRDGEGKARILHCSVVLDIGGTGRGDLPERQVEMRKAIYRILGKRSVAVLLSPEERKSLKKDINEALNTLLGEGTVKGVYFEKYAIL
ncbi:MAG: flagellar basal body-associated FliL family protein [Pseudomonadota bacterium]|nr:flagellar basal body-associated FliL family protein [Pseudomonadota bacterium]